MKTTRNRARRGIVVGSLLLLATLIPALPAPAEEVLREDFEGTVEAGETPGKDGKGWSHPEAGEFAVRSPRYQDLQVSFAGVTRGAISFDLQRQAGEVPLGRQTVFAIQDAAGRNLFFLQVAWESEKNSGRTLFRLRGPVYRKQSLGLWSQYVPLGRTITAGEWIHVDLTWDDGKKEYDLFVDGRPADVSPRHWDPAAGLLVAGDIRLTWNQQQRAAGQPVQFTAQPFGALLSRATAIRLGVNYQTGDLQGFSPLQKGVLDNFTVHAGSLPGAGAGLSVASLSHDASGVAGFAGSLVAGDGVTVTLEGTPGEEALFDVARLADWQGRIPLSWKGWGVYFEEKIFFDDGEVDLRDVEEYRVYASTVPLDVNGVTADTPYLETLEVEEQEYVLEEALVPADGEGDPERNFLEAGAPYYVAVLALMDDESLRPVILPKQNLPMTEVEGSPGTYEGVFTVGYGDRYPEAAVVGRIVRGGASVGAVGDELFEIDARLTIEVATSPEEIKADEKSTAEVKVTVTDANGEAVADREIRFLLATTSSQYTGVVGGGSFAEEVGGTLGRELTVTTDLFGQAEMTYTAGFAAKTAIIVARDMESGDTGAGYVKTYINATAELELEAVQEVAGKSLGYSIVVTSSDEWLTADGESEARITALVTKDGVPVQGHRIGFSVSGGSGTVRTVQGVTDEDGKARAVYTAGKRIGVVLVRAVDHTVGISGAVQIELRSDAPAKIGVVVTPDVLPADGRSTADVEVVVTDINDNPNEGVEVEYAVALGSGRLRSIDEVTDSSGESTAQYVAGTIPGKVSIEVTVRSAVPTEEDLLAARELVTAVTDYDFY